MSSPCIICEIINKNLNSFIIFENESYIAFLDIHPVFLGHCLLSPKKHYTTLYDVPLEVAQSFLQIAQPIGLAIQQAMEAEGSFIAFNNIVSQSIPHVHMHLIPRKKGDGLKGFFWPRMKYSNEEEMKETQLKIKRFL